MKNIFFLTLIISTLISCNKEENQVTIEPELTVTDADGNVYQTIKVGNQIWMRENLKTTTYNDGTSINEYEFGDDWHNGNTQIDYYQWAYTPPGFADDDFGAMYNHFAIESGKLAPEGWRIPTTQDFLELENYLANNGQSGTEGEALKTTTDWPESIGNGTDAVGFKGLPNGYIHAFGGKVGLIICTWATSDVNLQNSTRTVINLSDLPTIIYENNAIQIGAGIRCIKE
jgi:uncharacterized protein (TIGR02145 family)